MMVNMYCMFYNCTKLSSLDLSHFNTERVTNMYGMFMNCSNLTNLNITSFNTGNVTNMELMFHSCEKLGSLDLSNFNTSNVTTMYCMFMECSNLTNLDVTSFNTSKVTNMEDMFYLCSKLTSLNVSNFNTANVTKMSGMFMNCSKLTNLDVTSFNTSKVTKMDHMFTYCSNLTSLDLAGFNTANVTSMVGLFMHCYQLADIDLGSFNTAKVSDMQLMFYSCSKLKVLDLSSFNTSAVTATKWMFDGCSELTTIVVGDGWNVSNVTNSVEMFSRCPKLVGGAGTIYDADHVDKEYAHVDGGLSNPGYLSYNDNNLIHHGGLWYQVEPNTSYNELCLVRPQNGATYSGVVDIPAAFSLNGTVWAVTGIGEGAFTRTAVTAVNVPSGVTRIRNRAFYGAQNLRSLLLATDKAPNKLTLLGTDIIGDNASNFACYVKNSNLPAWQLRYSSVNFLPWVVTQENGFLTFSCVRNVTLPEGLSAYTVTGFNTARRMATSTKLSSSKIPANNGVILKGTPSTRYLFSAAASVSSLGDNMLRSLNGIEDIPYAPFAASPDDTKAYFLGSNCVDWYEFQNNIDLFMSINTGIAYLAVDKTLLDGDYTSHVLLDLWSTSPGDVTGEGLVDVEDVNAAINIILHKKTPADYTGNADVTGEGIIDVEDVNAIINIILKL